MKIDLSDKQLDFLAHSDHAINYVWGPVSTGKSHALVWRAYHRLMHEAKPGSLFLMTAQTVDNLYNNLVRDLVAINPQKLRYTQNPASIHIPSRNIKVICSGALTEGDFKRISGPSYTGGWFATEMHFLPKSFYLIAYKGCRPGIVPKFFDSNTADPQHYLKTEVLDNKALDCRDWFFEFEDNPMNTPESIAELKAAYSGTPWMYQRYILGQWVAGSESPLYPEWRDEERIIDRFEIPYNWPRYRTIDFGYALPKHAFVCLWVAKVPPTLHVPGTSVYGPAYVVYREMYTGETLNEYLGDEIERLSERDPHSVLDVADPEDPEGIETLREHGMPNLQGAYKGRCIDQFRAVKGLIQKNQIYFFRDALVHPPNQTLVDARYAHKTTDEFPKLSWAIDRHGDVVKEDIKDEQNHGFKALSYLELSIEKYVANVVTEEIMYG